MSMPNIPDINPTIDIKTPDVINLLLASIAFEELGLAHIINAEAEKIQSVLGTLPGQTVNNPTVNQLERIDNITGRVLRDVIKKEMLLQFKLEDILDLLTATDN